MTFHAVSVPQEDNQDMSVVRDALPRPFPFVLLVAENCVFAYDVDMNYGDIFIFEYNIGSGRKVRTLATGLPHRGTMIPCLCTTKDVLVCMFPCRDSSIIQTFLL